MNFFSILIIALLTLGYCSASILDHERDLEINSDNHFTSANDLPVNTENSGNDIRYLLNLVLDSARTTFMNLFPSQPSLYQYSAFQNICLLILVSNYYAADEPDRVLLVVFNALLLTQLGHYFNFRLTNGYPGQVSIGRWLVGPLAWITEFLALSTDEFRNQLNLPSRAIFIGLFVVQLIYFWTAFPLNHFEAVIFYRYLFNHRNIE